MANGEIVRGLNHQNPSVDIYLDGIRDWQRSIDKMAGEQREVAERAFAGWADAVLKEMRWCPSQQWSNELKAWESWFYSPSENGDRRR